MALKVILTAAVLTLLTRAGVEGNNDGVSSGHCGLAGAASLLMRPASPSQALDPITIVVKNNNPNEEKTYETSVANGGILIGAMTRLMMNDNSFTFTYIMDINYGPFLESVNGVAGNNKDQTYWELLVIKPDGSTIKPNVGIGCYIPNAKDKILFNFTTWEWSEGCQEV
ncbi:hypothetical protein OJAV_G00083100 [Oryzias javanicus]|uniref:Transcobalamin-like C-terminal domain-containing protein n=1 Tax=Oryzias javanicus TaxID=123683 RepID=A0A437D562_ORYJA|nr:hypothetical protein OJAV_G00083100 [Oryzias javanicus]